MGLKFRDKFNKSSYKRSKLNSKLKNGFEILFYAIIASVILRWVLLEVFAIPTSSMENSLLAGDYLFVSKVHYGPRTPVTPLQIPLTHQRIWGTDIPSYLDIVQLPQYRMPGFSEIKYNDIIVFNFPGDNHPIDLKTNYVKRCIALPGDTILIEDSRIYLNQKLRTNPTEIEYSYLVYTRNNNSVNTRVFKKNGIRKFFRTENGYKMYATPGQAQKLSQFPFIEQVQMDKGIKNDPETGIFPSPKVFKWNRDFFGPLVVPKAGMTITLTPENIIKYVKLITAYEDNSTVDVENGQLKINRKSATHYTFKQNYYFVLGDNRHDSKDSRYWGFVPEDHIVGKALFIWLSIDPEKPIFQKIRWDRIFKLIE